MSAETAADEQLLIRYLLDSLPEAETERLDELSISDDDFAWRLHAAENDLVDAYIRNELAGDTLDRFRSIYLATPARRAKVDFAKVLLSVTRNHAPPRPHAWYSAPLVIPRWTVAAGAALAVVTAAALIYNQRKLQSEVAQLQASRTVIEQHDRDLRFQLDRLSAPAAQPLPPPPLPPAELAILLPPPTRAAVRPPIVRIPSGTPRVNIDLQLEANDFPLYLAALKNASTGQVLWREDSLKPHSAAGRMAVAIALPPQLLKSGRYLLELSSADAQGEPIGNYPFDVINP